MHKCERVIRDGKVAALIIRGYGAGRSSWCHDVVWIPEGTEFIVTEYDGYEGIQIKTETKWEKA